MHQVLHPILSDGLLSRLARGDTPTRQEAYAIARAAPDCLDDLMAAASESRSRRQRNAVTYSRSLFIPLTNICRDRCRYCTFRKDPGDPGARIIPPEEVLATARKGALLGCTEVLFSLGDKPETFAWTRDELKRWGYRTIVEYLADMCEGVVAEAGLFPHTNAGVIGRAPMERLRRSNVSMGLMVESTSPALLAPGGAHDDAPDKIPRRRLHVLELAGQLRIPFTTGMLVGIGEQREDWVDTLWAIRESHRRHGHIQEVIIQNFRAKSETPMAKHPEPGETAYLLSVCLSRFILGPGMNIQAPPNLNPGGLERLLAAGVNDWGGVSPLTIDYINPEAPWPGVVALERAAASASLPLRERLPVYPEFLARDEYLDPGLLARVRAMTDAEGYVPERRR